MPPWPSRKKNCTNVLIETANKQGYENNRQIRRIVVPRAVKNLTLKKVKVTAWCQLKGLVTRTMHAKYHRSIFNTSEDMSQVKSFCNKRTDRQTDEWVLMSPAFAKAWGTKRYICEILCPQGNKILYWHGLTYEAHALLLSKKLFLPVAWWSKSRSQGHWPWTLGFKSVCMSNIKSLSLTVQKL